MSPVIKLLCPNCMKSVSVPDDVAGTEIPCPECQKPFPVPVRYNPVVATPPSPVLPVVPPSAPTPTTSAISEPATMSPAPNDRPPPPPGLVPPVYPSPNTHPDPLTQLLLGDGYTRSHGITISPRVMAWVPAICLTLILVLSVFDWIGAYSAGSPVYTQNAWRALIGSVSRNLEQEKLVKSAGAANPQSAWPEGVVDHVRGDWIMLPYLIALLLATAVAWAERMVATLDPHRLPKQLHWVAVVWPHRIAITAGLATVALLCLVIQVWSGFGLEGAMQKAVSKKFEEKRKIASEEKNKTTSPSDPVLIDFEEKEELARFKLERTTWLYLAVILHILIVLAILVRSWLDRRGHKPLPRIVLQY